MANEDSKNSAPQLSREDLEYYVKAAEFYEKQNKKRPEAKDEARAGGKREGGGVKKVLFLAGLASGILLAKNWRTVTKESIKAGVLFGRKVKEISQQALEEVEDVAAEALDELPHPENRGQG